jgi:hypothetical protein
MEILADHAEHLVAEGILDEWHLWDFTRNDADSDWLRDRFRRIRRIPGSLTYERIGELGSDDRSFSCFARARNDLHLALRPVDGGPCLEFVIGGWGNNKSVARVVGSELLFEQTRSVEDYQLAERETPGVLSSDRFRAFVIEIDASGRMQLRVDGRILLECDVVASAGPVEVFARSGYGSDAEIRVSEGGSDGRIGIYVGDRTHRPIYHQAYWHYVRHAREYEDCVFVKCDDDIVYLDATRIAEFIRYRIDHPAYFLVSANVVNNGVCAFYQQEMGIIPRSLMELEMPPGGFAGSLWSSWHLAGLLHDHFLDDPERFRRPNRQVVEWSERISINFVAWLGHDLQHMYFDGGDDEHIISTAIPKMLGRTNAIYMPFTVGHLSFGSQDGKLDTASLVTRYRALAAAR